MVDAVTLCIPAYNAEAFLAEALASVRAQTWPEIRVVLSVDCSTDRTAELARELAGDATLLLQTKRLGWVGNTNAALREVKTRFAMILPHDDLIAPTYVEACMRTLHADPGAVAAYSDITTVGAGALTIRQPSLIGAPVDRILAFLRDHFPAVAFRAVFDASRVPRHAVPAHAVGDFAADTLWVARLLVRGHLLRVSEVLYSKRLHHSSAHAQWKRASRDELAEMWAVHCAELAYEFLRARPTLALDRRFWRALQDRLTERGSARFIPRQIQPSDAERPLRRMAQTYWRVRRRQPPYRWLQDLRAG
jgi:glycosyltransferase involved in cell wall biosynthesis